MNNTIAKESLFVFNRGLSPVSFLFRSYFAALGLEIILEDVTNFGRIDMTVKFNDNVYLFEFKVVELVPNGKALQQLIDKNYAQKYQALNQPIHLIGVEFSKDARSVVGFEFLTILMKIDPI